MPNTPRDVFDRMAQEWLSRSAPNGALLAEDAVLEMPFAPPGQPARFEGRENVLAYTTAGRAAFRSGSTSSVTSSCTRPPIQR
ncbi:hypothetical protein GCM10020369_10500 [Cryptosporangium minutisporangium]|uniref:SnoaL-like domain-containing protein n=1 Tax=Cryptosporangium minutisporangium TaxID=113569 RepID=A0ABP6SRG5_9ACTN